MHVPLPFLWNQNIPDIVALSQKLIPLYVGKDVTFYKQVLKVQDEEKGLLKSGSFSGGLTARTGRHSLFQAAMFSGKSTPEKNTDCVSLRTSKKFLQHNFDQACQVLFTDG